MLALIVGAALVVIGSAFAVVAVELLRMRKALVATLDLVSALIDDVTDLNVRVVTGGKETKNADC